MKYLVLATLLTSSLSLGLDTDKVAHAGVGYICQDVGRKLSQGILRLDRLDATVFAAGVCLFGGLVKEATDKRPDSGDIAAQALGQALAITFSWDF